MAAELLRFVKKSKWWPSIIWNYYLIMLHQPDSKLYFPPLRAQKADPWLKNMGVEPSRIKNDVDGKTMT